MITFSFEKKLRSFVLRIDEEIKTETVTLIGHSGCGKTTLLKVIAGLVKSDKGKIMLDNKTLLNTSICIPPYERNIGYVPQNYALFPHLSVKDNILYGIQKLDKNEQEKRIDDVTQLFRLTSLLSVKPTSISFGEQQRVALARALVTKPKLLLLDEPLSALDVSTRTHVRGELQKILKSLRIPTIIVTHDAEDALVLGEKVFVMEKGEILQKGTYQQLHDKPVNDFVANFMGTNFIKRDAKRAFSFKPWDAKLHAKAGKSPLQWYGKIRSMANYGKYTRYYIESSQIFLVDLEKKSNSAKFAIGTDVFVSISPTKIHTYGHR